MGDVCVAMGNGLTEDYEAELDGTILGAAGPCDTHTFSDVPCEAGCGPHEN